MAVGPSSSIVERTTEVDGTSDGVVVKDMRTSEGGPTDDFLSSEKLEPPVFLEFFSVMRHRFASPTTLYL